MHPLLPQGAIYRVDLADGAEAAEASLFRRIATKGFSPDQFETKQVGPAWSMGWHTMQRIHANAQWCIPVAGWLWLG